jgi:cysteine desulfurase
MAGHKLYAPKGIGALYVRRGTSLQPFMLGAGHERGVRPGTENVASIVGLGVACEIADGDLESVALHLKTLRDELWQRLRERIPGLAQNGHPDERLPNTLNVRFPRVSGLTLLATSPQIAASTGSACHAGGEAASSVITAMGIAADEALGSVRLSLGRLTTTDEIEQASVVLTQAWAKCAAAK